MHIDPPSPLRYSTHTHCKKKKKLLSNNVIMLPILQRAACAWLRDFPFRPAKVWWVQWGSGIRSGDPPGRSHRRNCYSCSGCQQEISPPRGACVVGISMGWWYGLPTDWGQMAACYVGAAAASQWRSRGGAHWQYWSQTEMIDLRCSESTRYHMLLKWLTDILPFLVLVK